MRVLVTGAAGGVARQLLPGLEGKYELRLTDLADGDLADARFVHRVTAGVDAIVHLAACANPASSWAELLKPNLEVVTNILAAAGMARVVLASSVHVLGQYRQLPIEPEWPSAPCCPYGATKAFAEAAGRAHHHRTGASVVCLRLGATQPVPPAVEAMGAWLAPADLRRLVVRALEASAGFTICPGISANSVREWSTHNDIGYEPQCDSELYRATTPDVQGWGTCRGAGM